MATSRRICRRIELAINLALLVLLAGNLLVFGRIAAAIGQIGERLAHVAIDPMPARGASQATASGNVVHVGAVTGGSVADALPSGPRTVEQVAAFLGVTPDTVRDSYIPAWIAEGLMAESARAKNRWLIPDTFTPYRPR